MPEFLTILMMTLPVFLATDAAAAEIRITHPSRVIFEVSGGNGNHAWHIQYGLPGTDKYAGIILTLAGPGPAAYFSHGNWLRRIDAEKGVVTGRWHFPGMFISALSWKDDRIEVEVEDQLDGNRSLRRVIDFNPDDPKIPYWPTASILAASIPGTEMHCCRRPNTKVEEAQQWLAEAENAVQRDPLSPWLRIELAHIDQALGKPGTAQLLEEASRSGPVEFSELLRLSGTLDLEGQKQAGREAFERGDENLWQRGSDPRLMSSLLGRLLLYSDGITDAEDRSQLIDRLYRLGPWTEAAEYAWDSYSTLLAKEGKVEEAQEWHRRSLEAREKSLYPFNSRTNNFIANVIALLPATLIAAVLYFLALACRYLPQRRMQSRAEEQSPIGRKFTFFNVEYWSKNDRIAFLTIIAIGWLASGFVGSFFGAITRGSSLPLAASMGSFAGPATISYFENDLSKTPERDLLLAMAYHHDGQKDKAEALYRGLQQFPESWNNLGALLKDSGKNDEARQAFEQALRLNPQMAEARLNLGNPPSDFWTKSHQLYLPGQAMLAPPRREHFLQAIGVGTPWQQAVQALGGPFTAAGQVRQTNRGPNLPPLFTAAMVLIIVLMAAALIFLLFMTPRDVTQPAPGFQPILEYLVPGTAPEWRWFGGIALTGLVFRISTVLLPGSGRGAFVGNPSIERSFGIPAQGSAIPGAPPDLAYFYFGIIALYAGNAAWIWHLRRKSSQL